MPEFARIDESRTVMEAQLTFASLNMSIPDYQFLMLPVLKAAAQGEVRIGVVVGELATQLQLTVEEKAELLPSGKPSRTKACGIFNPGFAERVMSVRVILDHPVLTIAGHIAAKRLVTPTVEIVGRGPAAGPGAR